MAEKETKSGSNLPWANIVALLVAAGGFLTLIPAIQTSRPPDPGGKSTPVFGDQTIPSRLWQDPFEEVMRDREGKEGKDGKEERLHQPGEIVNAIARDNDPQKEVGVLIVMMMSGPHAEARERRLRTRVAVVEGMSRSGYAPRDSEHLGYLHLPWPRGSSHLLDEWIAHDLFNAISLSIGHAGFFWWTPQKLVLTEVAADNHEDIPFEWFDLTPGHKLIDPVSRQNLKKVLVLYVQQDACRDGPFTRLAYLSKLLKLGSEPPGGDRNVPTTLLGPVTSDGLDAMVREARTMGNETRRGRDDFIRQQLHGIKIFSPTATAADDRLLGLDEDIAARNILIASANVGLEVSLLGPCRPGFPIIAGASYTWLTANSRVAGLVQWKFHHELTFQRTNLTDNDIVWEMIQELMRRGINPTRFIQDPMNPWGLAEPDPKRKINWKNPVAIITEMDSFRGRELPNTFRELCNPKRRTDDKDRWIYFYHYLRGLDGRLPGDEKDKKPGDPSNKEERKRSPNARPDGHDQTDSLLRLADTMATEDRERRNNGEMGFRAIGVLGSDVYDKLLILRALRPRFPDAVFFTNNLDAQLSQSEEWEAAHNLVVVSGFGVRLDKRWQRNIPPFRDGYQTATFLGTLVATGKFEEEMGKLVHKSQFDDLPTQPSRILDDIRDFPRVFEIGRNGALDLSVNSVGGMKTKKDGTWALKNAQVAEEYTDPKDLNLKESENTDIERQIIRIHPLRTDLKQWWAPEVKHLATLGTWSRKWSVPESLTFGALCALLFAWIFYRAAVSVRTQLPVGDTAPKKSWLTWVEKNYPIGRVGASHVHWMCKMLDAGSGKLVKEYLTLRTLVVGMVAAVITVLVSVGCKLDWFGDDLSLWLEGLSIWPGVAIWIFAITFAMILAYVRMRSTVSAGIVGAVIAVLLVSIGYRSQWIQGEPFAWFDGLSVWPGVAIRIFAIILAIHLVDKSCRSVGKNDSKIFDRFALSDKRVEWPEDKLPFRWWRHTFASWTDPDRARSGSRSSRLHTFASWTDPLRRGEQSANPNPASPFHKESFDAGELWHRYIWRGWWLHRVIRVGTLTLLFLLASWCAFAAFDGGFTSSTARSGIARGWDRGSMALLFIATTFVTLFVVDALWLNASFIRLSDSGFTRWPEGVVKGSEYWGLLGESEISEDLDIRLIATRTTAIGELILYPFVIIALLVVSRAPYFDDWGWTVGLIMVLAALLGFAVLAAHNLRHAAEDARKGALERLQAARNVAASRDGTEKKVHILDKMIERITSLDDGAFAPISQQPIIKALLFPAGGIGIWEMARQLLGKL